MSRLFVSGCSFTQHWPAITWPWFLSQYFDETYNFGWSGAGNEYIFHSIINADIQYNFNENDVVIIAWSGFLRFDNIICYEPANKNRWQCHGDWTGWGNDKPTYLIPYLNETGQIKKSIDYMILMSRYLKSKKISYLYTSLYDLRVTCDAILPEVYDSNFIYPEGLDTIKNKIFSKIKNDPPYGGHPNTNIQQIFAKRMADQLNLDMIIDKDWEIIDEAVKTESNLYNKQYWFNSHPLVTEAFENLFTPIENSVSVYCVKYNKKSLSVYKNLITNAFIPNV